MPTIASLLDAAFRQAIQDSFHVDADPLVTASQSDKFGDYQSNAAMGLVKFLSEQTGQKSNPRAIAEQIRAKVAPLVADMVSELTIAGPGFLNARLNPAWLSARLKNVAHDERLGVTLAVSPQTVVVDYSGPNIAKEMHVGHLRSTIIGDAIAKVLGEELGLGHHVIRQNHIGDWGTQFGMLIAYLIEKHRTGGNSADGVSVGAFGSGEIDLEQIDQITFRIADLEGFYKESKKRFDTDLTFQEEARRRVVRLQAGEPLELKLWRQIVHETRRSYERLYDRLQVWLRHEHEHGESQYNQMLPNVVADLKSKHLAVESDGATVVNAEGYESPLIIQKTDGGYLYGTTDLAAIRYRVDELQANRIIYTHDSRQQQHFAQVFWTAKKAGWAEGVSLEYAPFGTMLGEDGKPFKTRSGDTVKLKDLLNEAVDRAKKLVDEKNAELPEAQRAAIAEAIGIGAVKYSDLSKDRTSDYVFSWDKMLAMDGNTGPYLQYAYARIKSIQRKAAAEGVVASSTTTITLDSPFELALGKHILRLGETIDVVARDLKPHLLCLYLYDLAGKFSGFYENCPVLKSEEPLRSSRLMLAGLAARTMQVGLDLLGIQHPEQM